MMKWLDKGYQLAVIFMISILSSFIVMRLSDHAQGNAVYVVDLARIANAENMVAIKAQQNKAWMAVVDEASQTVKSVIEQIAGDHTVIVKQAVIAGTGNQIDITDHVLQALSLPLKTPVYIPPKDTTLLGIKASSQADSKIRLTDDKSSNTIHQPNSIFPL